MARHVLGWVDVALDTYVALTIDQQASLDRRLDELLDEPEGPSCRYDAESDTWTATDRHAGGFIVYTFRTDKPRLVVSRLIYL